MSRIVDQLQAAYEDKDIDFEEFLEVEISEYIGECQVNQTKPSLSDFLIIWGAIEFPSEECSEYRIVKYLKMIENEFYKSMASKNPQIAYELYKSESKVDTRQKIEISFASNLKEE